MTKRKKNKNSDKQQNAAGALARKQSIRTLRKISGSRMDTILPRGMRGISMSMARMGPTMTRAPSMSINRGAMTSELWRYAASVENKANIQVRPLGSQKTM